VENYVTKFQNKFFFAIIKKKLLINGNTVKRFSQIAMVYR